MENIFEDFTVTQRYLYFRPSTRSRVPWRFPFCHTSIVYFKRSLTEKMRWGSSCSSLEALVFLITIARPDVSPTRGELSPDFWMNDRAIATISSGDSEPDVRLPNSFGYRLSRSHCAILSSPPFAFWDSVCSRFFLYSNSFIRITFAITGFLSIDAMKSLYSTLHNRHASSTVNPLWTIKCAILRTRSKSTVPSSFIASSVNDLESNNDSS